MFDCGTLLLFAYPFLRIFLFYFSITVTYEYSMLCRIPFRNSVFSSSLCFQNSEKLGCEKNISLGNSIFNRRMHQVCSRGKMRIVFHSFLHQLYLTGWTVFSLRSSIYLPGVGVLYMKSKTIFLQLRTTYGNCIYMRPFKSKYPEVSHHESGREVHKLMIFSFASITIGVHKYY